MSAPLELYLRTVSCVYRLGFLNRSACPVNCEQCKFSMCLVAAHSDCTQTHQKAIITNLSPPPPSHHHQPVTTTNLSPLPTCNHRHHQQPVTTKSSPPPPSNNDHHRQITIARALVHVGVRFRQRPWSSPPRGSKQRPSSA